ncbi:hypothetical protein BG53_08910 [Paenibacillus darwinianus]|uniref:Lipoprotein n=1 Tax=Paenibacillus darwinianus TaxID=1380763 RepID=A0A9W5W643_9BACL|nr:hypothetical protein [Paenibacillus darwinianus]EXX85314.1 hypothetical protein BG53_08910 [Paenibacillus darwinianus]EXX86178.1 hypothetical protein CH50_07665 [Paenibacillus darwinianus]EXX86524.1 hypothetical protein BG52_06355 [Paenibacillus darwinianus]
MKRLMQVVLLISAAMVVLAGCSTAKAPKEAIETAFTKSMEMNSYTFTSALAVDKLELPASLLEGMDPSMVDMVKNATLNIDGVYQADPMQMEMTLKLDLRGDMAFSLNVLMILTQDKMWVKIPQIPGFPLGDAAGKFVEIDMKQLAEEQGVGVPELDINKQRKMTEDMAGIFFKHFDEKTYFTEVKKDEVAGLPEDVKPNQIVKFNVTQETFEPLVMTIVDKVAPEIIDLLLNNEDYRKTFQLEKADLEQAKKDLAEGDRSELRKGLDEFKKNAKVNDLSLTTAIVDELPVYQVAKADLDYTQEGETAKAGLTFTTRYSNINEKVEFPIGIPKDAMSMEELMNSFMGPAL